MKKVVLLVCCCLLGCLSGLLKAQISHGGKPLPLLTLRSGSTIPFVEMPAFDREAALLSAFSDTMELRNGAPPFAYKFTTDLHPDKDGVHFTLADGTRVWRLGIRSREAVSLNLLFTEYELPEGAKLFLYNSDQSHLLGAFTHLNNSKFGLLPVAPVRGEEVIVEYHEPPSPPFKGRLRIGEVNHGLRASPGAEPQPNYGDLFKCMAPVICYADGLGLDEPISSSVVLLLINGQTMGSGALINNTANDGTPYLLTAAHCITANFGYDDPADWERLAATTVVFFNYESPTCQTVLRGTEEMSMASLELVAVNIYHDMALLKLTETPPAYYRPYYAGWNSGEAVEENYPFFGIHHPRASIKRLNICEEALEPATFSSSGLRIEFEEQAHWHVGRWQVGSTYGGSSGSPLFDRDGRIIGALTGGMSVCSRPENDYYYAISGVWDKEEEPELQLAHWLDPTESGVRNHHGFDPYQNQPLYRVSNVRDNGLVDEVEILKDKSYPLFGNSDELDEFVERYQTEGEGLLYGAYFVSEVSGQQHEIEVEVTVYLGDDKPEQLLYTQIFSPTYQNVNGDRDGFLETPKPLNRVQESFIRFDDPVEVGGTFFVGYKIIDAPQKSFFATANVTEGENRVNSVWTKYRNEWVEVSDVAKIGFPTSLYIDPVLSYNPHSDAPPPLYNEELMLIRGNDHTLHILLPEGISGGMLTIHDGSGKLIGQYPINQVASSIRLPDVLPGVYIVALRHASGLLSKKILF
ncbi:T9SS type A sorting domain-containing protein [Parabacteroides sp. OttesenSCG-928-N08]|nr:T9SS type A sorting domain-containing protein [Parabacteroides sp. OttesenSCG-928-N08]